jgi:hypothetical protein
MAGFPLAAIQLLLHAPAMSLLEKAIASSVAVALLLSLVQIRCSVQIRPVTIKRCQYA